jgi:hypothetical protein
MTIQFQQALIQIKQKTKHDLEVGINNALVYKHQRDQSKTNARTAYYNKKLTAVNENNLKLIAKLQVLDKQLQSIQQENDNEIDSNTRPTAAS